MRSGTGYTYAGPAVITTLKCEGCGARYAAAQMQTFTLRGAAMTLRLRLFVQTIMQLEALQIAERTEILACSLPCAVTTVCSLVAQGQRMLADPYTYPPGFAMLGPSDQEAADGR